MSSGAREASDVKSIFGKAQEIAAPALRAAYVEEACRGDAVLRAEIERLLAAADEAGEFMEGPAVGMGHTALMPPVSEGPGTMIGPYKLMEQIGEGGFGLVFVAEQQRPVRRKVALKIIKPGMDSRDIIARFEAERQALALMDHPNIAKVFDAGVVGSASRAEPDGTPQAPNEGPARLAGPTGRPYFVMELVRGVPITDYCDQHHLTPRQRLELFTSVCHAIQHAHQKGIIHRDVKPTNVLVTLHDGVPVVKVIDFGVAKALSQQLTERTIYTQFAQMLGTPLYMSPEQAEMSGLDIDTRSDIYSLGVVLYELLTGTTPFDRERLKKAAVDEIRRILCEEEPPRPSTRISQSGDQLASIAAQRNTEPGKLTKLVRGDLDWIVMKCLEKDRTRRYETANGLARDIERYLRDEPVEACPPSLGYRLRKLAKRHKRALATAVLLSIVIAAALSAVAGTIGWAVRDSQARRAAVEHEVQSALREAKTAYDEDRLSEAMALVRQSEGLLAGSGPPDELRDRVRRWKCDLEMARQLDENRLESATDVKDDSFDGTLVIDGYKSALKDYGVNVEELELLHELDRGIQLSSISEDDLRIRLSAEMEVVAQIRRSPISERLIAALDDWAHLECCEARSKLLALADRADNDAWRKQVRKATHQNDVEALKELAQGKRYLRQSPITIRIFAKALNHSGERELATQVLRDAQRRYPNDFWLNHDLGWQLRNSDPKEAVGFLRVAISCRPDSPGARLNLGMALKSIGRYAEAQAEYLEAIRLKRDYSTAFSNLGALLCDYKKDFDGAIAAFKEAIRLKPDHAGYHYNLGNVLRRNGQLDEAISAYREAIRLDADDASSHVGLGDALSAKGQLEEAIAAYREAIRLAPEHSSAHHSLGHALRQNGQQEEGIAAFRESVRIQPDNAKYHRCLGNAFRNDGQLDEAITSYREAIRLQPDYRAAHDSLRIALHEKKQTEEAIGKAKEESESQEAATIK